MLEIVLWSYAPLSGVVMQLMAGPRGVGLAIKSSRVWLPLWSSVLRQEICWEERLRNDLFCVEWDVKR